MKRHIHEARVLDAILFSQRLFLLRRLAPLTYGTGLVRLLATNVQPFSFYFDTTCLIVWGIDGESVVARFVFSSSSSSWPALIARADACVGAAFFFSFLVHFVLVGDC
jgi:hypothetical protein